VEDEEERCDGCCRGEEDLCDHCHHNPEGGCGSSSGSCP
jgi:hypothetical protein